MCAENLPVLEKRDGVLRVVGKITRPAAHGSNPVFHATAIIIAVLPDGRLLLADKTEKQRRKYALLHKKPSSRRTYDCFGGHMRYEDIPAAELVSGLSAETFLKCAVRELSEELLEVDENGASRKMVPDARVMVPLGLYELANDHNREYSWVFLYPLHSAGPYTSEDTLMTPEGETLIRQPIRPVSWDELLQLYSAPPSEGEGLSDALGRVLDLDGGERLKQCLKKL